MDMLIWGCLSDTLEWRLNRQLNMNLDFRRELGAGDNKLKNVKYILKPWHLRFPRVSV